MEQRDKLLAAVGQRIRELREGKGFSQEGFSLEVNLHRNYYGRVERGEQNLSILNLMKIAVILDVDLGELLPKTNQIRKDILALIKENQ
jgi:transcriptional regulator with XRE-family HTH domain